MPKYRYVSVDTARYDDFETAEPLQVGGSFATGRYSGDIREATGEGFITVAGSQIVRLDVPATALPDQAFKADGGKPNWFLLMSGKGCAAALAGVVRVLSFAVRPVAEGGKGYTEHSWRQVPNARERYEAALYRHLNKIALGELVDDESGESHWDHVTTNALFLSELTKAGQ